MITTRPGEQALRVNPGPESFQPHDDPKMRRVVYLIDQPLDEWNYNRFGIQTWIDRGWDVEVWDLTPLAYPRVWRDFMESGRKLRKFEGYFPVARKNQLDAKCSQGDKIGYFIDFAGDAYCSLRAQMALVRSGAIRVSCATGSVPAGSYNRRGFGSRLGGLLAKGPIQASKRFVRGLARRLAGRSARPGLVIVSGKRSISPAGNNCETVRAHNLDYDIYLGMKAAEVAAGEHAVFVDQDLCSHSDSLREDVESCVAPSRYFPALCRGLKKVSALLNVGIRIAAHPRASYRYTGAECFEGIPVEYGKTAELIRSCRLVLCHYSTAAQFAVLFRKPVVFVTTDELASSAAGEYVPEFAAALGKSIVNLDGDLESVDWQKELRVDEQRYDAYRNEYIKMDGSPELPYWDIVINHIEKAGAGTPAR